MASLKNVDKTKQRIHKERSQLVSRQHLGNLEKKKDYKLRSQHNQKKRDTLKVLRQKALDRNPDEFYYHMINSKCEDGVHVEKDKTIDEDTVEQEKLMRSQNLRYVSFKLQQERKKIDKLLSVLHMCDPSVASNTHTVFVEGKKEAKHFNAAKHFQTHSIFTDRRFNRPKLSELKSKSLTLFCNKEDLNSVERERKKMYDELSKRISREKELLVVQQKLQAKKFVAESGGTKPKKVKNGNATRAPVYKWRQERKR